MLTPRQRVRLQIVPADQILPHEIADPGREQRIERRLRQDRLLRDPLIVGQVPDVEGYVLLDGTNRKRALASLGLPWAMVQVLNYTDPHAVELRTWCHAVQDSLPNLLEHARSIDGLEPVPLEPLESADALRERSTVAVLLNRHERFVLRRRSDNTASRAWQLCQLVDRYEDRMSREDCDAESVEERAALMSGEDDGHRTLVAFPLFSRSQVLSMAINNIPVPAGITRHIITGGRALRVNFPLDCLSSHHTVEQSNEALREHLTSLQPRHYQEPTVLFDS